MANKNVKAKNPRTRAIVSLVVLGMVRRTYGACRFLP